MSAEGRRFDSYIVQTAFFILPYFINFQVGGLFRHFCLTLGQVFYYHSELDGSYGLFVARGGGVLCCA